MARGALTRVKSAIVCGMLGAAGGGCNQIPTLAATAVAARGSAYFKKLLFTSVETKLTLFWCQSFSTSTRVPTSQTTLPQPRLHSVRASYCPNVSRVWRIMSARAQLLLIHGMT
jgi:hypothetical protein